MDTPTKPRSGLGRPVNPQPHEKWHISLPTNVSIYWRMRHHDEFTKRTRVGALSALVERLLREEAKRDGIEL